MASFNTNSAPSPFGGSSGVPSSDVGAQFFLGCSVVDFNINADWASQGGSLSVTLIEDTHPNSNLDYDDGDGLWSLGTTYVQKLRDTAIYDYATSTQGSLPVMGSPQHFRLVDTLGNIIFQYDGILSSISRSASPSGGKKYVIEIGSPLKLLENCAMVLAELPGLGYAIEGNPYETSFNGYPWSGVSNPSFPGGYTGGLYGVSNTLDENLDSSANNVNDLHHNEIYDSGSFSIGGVRPASENIGFAVNKNFLNQNEGVQFGSNNQSVDFANVYNLQNVFGIYENESDGLIGYAKYGASQSAGNNDGGIKLSMVAFALDELINRNPSSAGSKKKFGGNIISGTTTYNIYDVYTGTIESNPYFFGFDVYTFSQELSDYLGEDYIYTGSISSNVLEFVSTLCNDAGLDFIVELNRIQTSDISADNYWDGVDTVSNYNCPGSLYDGGTFHLEKSYTNSVPGGIISVKVLDRGTFDPSSTVHRKTPFSKVAYQILGYECPDFGDYGTALMNPGDPSTSDTNFESGVNSTTYLDPLDDDFVRKGTDGSTPYGGKFPVAKTTDMNNAADPLDLRENASQTSIKIQDNQQVSAKFLVGGKQSRAVVVPREYIYHYWGKVRVSVDIVSTKYDTGEEGDTPINYKDIPVITPFLEELDVVDFILIDMRDIFKEQGVFEENTICNAGIYSASLFEIRTAMASYREWEEFFFKTKSCAIFGYMKSLGYSIKYIGDFLSGMTLFGVDEEGVKPEAPNRKEEEPESDSPVDEPSREKEANNKVSVITEKLFNETLVKIHEKIKNIGDTHYGKSWAVWSPQVTARTPDWLNDIGEVDYSWSPVEDAYIEPSQLAYYEAPEANNFRSGNRINGWGRYPTNVSEVVIDRARNLQGKTGPGSFHVDDLGDKSFHPYTDLSESSGIPYDFSQVGDSDIAHSYLKHPESQGFYENQKWRNARTHVKISSDSEFLFAPYDYFKYYSRDRKMFFDIETEGDETFYTIDYTGSTYAVDYPGMLADTGIDIYGAVTAKGTENINFEYSKVGQSSEILTNAYLPSSIDYKRYDPIDSGSGTAIMQGNLSLILCETGIPDVGVSSTSGVKDHINNAQLVKDFVNLSVPQDGVNCITFTKITTPFVGFPPSSGDSISDRRLNAAISVAIDAYESATHSGIVNSAPGEESKENKSAPSQNPFEAIKIHPPCVQPWEVGLPQQSNRHHYGPWFSSNKFLYAGKVEYIQDDALVPENYVFPGYGTLDTTDPNVLNFTSNLSGFTGMNIAGESIVDSLDNYGQFAAEDGSVTLQGPPIISRIGDALFTNGPFVTSMSVSAQAGSITTKYVFNSVNNRVGKTNHDYVKKIQRMSNKIASKGGK